MYQYVFIDRVTNEVGAEQQVGRADVSLSTASHPSWGDILRALAEWKVTTGP